MQLSKIAVGALIVAVISTSAGCASGSGALPQADCEVLNTFSSNKVYAPWKEYEKLAEAVESIKQEAKSEGFSIEEPYYKKWLSNLDEAVDAHLRQIEGDAGRASAGIGKGEIKSALVSVAANASQGNLGILEGLATRCLSN